jgi:putative addiction module killer protein
MYETPDGKVPFSDWMEELAGTEIYGAILVRMRRVEKGNLGNWRSVGNGVCELRFDIGPGYRVYFGQDGDLIVLLNGGAKKTQAQDIAKAKHYWRDYNA